MQNREKKKGRGKLQKSILLLRCYFVTRFAGIRVRCISILN